jgi:hypothetical protein
VTVDIIDAGMLSTEDEAGIKVQVRGLNVTEMNTNNAEYEADIKIHQGRRLDMHKKPETRDVRNDITDVIMLNTEHKTDIINTVIPNTECEAGIQVHQGREINMFKEAETRMLKTNPKYKNVNVDIINAIKFNKEYGADRQVHRDREINMFEEPEMRMLKTTPKGKDDKNVMDKKPETTDVINAVILNTEYEASTQVHQDDETNMFEEAETRMLKTNPKGKNNAVIPIEDPNTVQW